VVPPAYGEKYAKLIPGAQLRVIPACGHLLPFEKPAEFAAALVDFLS
jgi:pimeloyl-ACP methyl ester carboxylesterase